jgi:hypothetical protein
MPFILNKAYAISFLAHWYRENPNYNAFSHKALEAIADYLDETETTMEVDPIQLACEWEEFETVEALREHLECYTGYSNDLVAEALLEWVNAQTICLPFECGVQTRYVLAQF